MNEPSYGVFVFRGFSDCEIDVVYPEINTERNSIYTSFKHLYEYAWVCKMKKRMCIPWNCDITYEGIRSCYGMCVSCSHLFCRFTGWKFLLQVCKFLPVAIAVWIGLEEGIKHFTSWSQLTLIGRMWYKNSDMNVAILPRGFSYLLFHQVQ